MRSDPKRRRLSPKDDDGEKIGFTGAFTVKVLPDVLERLNAVVARDPNNLGRSAIVAKWIDEKLASLPVGQGSSAPAETVLPIMKEEAGDEDAIQDGGAAGDHQKNSKGRRKTNRGNARGRG